MEAGSQIIDSFEKQDVDGFLGFRRAPEGPKLNVDVIETKKSTTFIQTFNQYTERIRVENHVYTTNIGRPINLRAFHEETAISHGSQFNNKKFAALVIRWRDPRIALLFFSCGKLVCSGAKNKYQARIVIKDALEIVRKIGYTDVSISKVQGRLQNMVVSVKLTFAVDLDSLATARSDICKYNKELFPGASLKIPKLGSINISVHSGGRLIITGAKEIMDIKRSINAVIPILLKHMRPITVDPITKLNAKAKGEGTFAKISDINYNIEKLKNKIEERKLAKPVAESPEPSRKRHKGNNYEGVDEQEFDIDDIPLFKTNVDVNKLPDTLRMFLPL